MRRVVGEVFVPVMAAFRSIVPKADITKILTIRPILPPSGDALITKLGLFVFPFVVELAQVKIECNN